MATRRQRRRDERQGKRREQRAPPAREGVLARVPTDWIVAGIILAVVAIAAVIFISRQVFGGGGSAAPNFTVVHALAVNPASPRTLFLGAPNGLYRSTDGGRKWARLDVRDEVREVEVDPANPANLLVAAGTALRRSSDGGATFETVVTNLPNGLFGSLASDPADRARVYAYVAGQGLYRSDDGGSRWTLQNAVPSSQITSLAVKPGAPDTIYAFDNAEGLVTSADGGKRFTRIEGLASRNRVTDILAIPGQPETLLVAGAGTGAGVARSLDGGRTWAALTTGLDSIDVRALAHDPKTSTLYAADFVGVVYVSSNGGESWAKSGA